jgi:hypothetical protein
MEVILIDLLYVAILEMRSACNKFEREIFSSNLLLFKRGPIG